MTKKEVVRKVWSVFSYLYLFYITVQFLNGEADTLSKIFLFVCYSSIALVIIVKIIDKIIKVVYSYKLYKSYKNGLEYLKAVHQVRYKLYFTGSNEDVEKYSEEIEKYGAILLSTGENAITSNLLIKKHSQEVQAILEQTKKLMTTVR